MDRRNAMNELLKLFGHANVVIVGIDVSKLFHVLTIYDGYGTLLVESTEINVFTSGFDMLKSLIQSVKLGREFKHLIIGCEPSGHYYLNLMRCLKQEFPDANLRLVNTSAVKSNREQQNEYSKTDSIDAHAIADLLIRGESYQYTQEEPVYQSIKEYVKTMDQLTKDITRLKNRIHAYLDDIYPGLESHFTSFTSTQLGHTFIQWAPDPLQLKMINATMVEKAYKSLGGRIYKKHAEKIAVASKSMLIVDNPMTNTKRALLKELSANFIRLENARKNIESLLYEQLETLEYTKNLESIKGLGLLTIGRIIAYLGNPLRFKNGSQAASFAGLIPSREQSGSSLNREKGISKRGHRKLRSAIIQSAQIAISNSAYFTAYYNRLVLENHKDPNVAIVATAHKLLRCIIKIIHSGEAFAPPTIFEPEFAQIKISRLTKKKLRELKNDKRLLSGTHLVTDIYPTRV